MAVRANAHAPALSEVIHCRENTVAQVGFGGQAQPGNGLALRHPLNFVRIGVGCMHQAPALIDLDVVIQPLDRALAAPTQAVVDFLLLLGDMDMHRASRVAGLQHFVDLFGRDGAQRVEAQPQGLRRLLREQWLELLL